MTQPPPPEVMLRIKAMETELKKLREVERLAIALCNSSNETEQNEYRRQLGILLCGWPKEREKST